MTKKIRVKGFWRLGLGLALGLAAFDAAAQRGARPMGEESGGEPARQLERLTAMGLFTTGLAPRFPQAVTCPAISSPHGSPTRYDGSPRSNDHYGLHNGIDITLEAGTPLLALADATIVHVGTGGRLVGNFIWLHVAPEASGRPFHAFVRYQHLDQPSPLTAGTRVTRGEVVGSSGNTGTTGGYYGIPGYAHLHFNVLISQGPEFNLRGAMVVPESVAFLDPLGLYVEGMAADNHALRNLAATEPFVAVGVRTAKGALLPDTAQVIWPVACTVGR
jgi:murein DD-endopeptidase MepM/ murein hydrolase activator NlpD